MRTIVNCLIVLLMLLFQKTEAATPPLSHGYVLPTIDTNLSNSPILTTIFDVPPKKPGFLKKLQYKILQKKIKFLLGKRDKGTPSKSNVASIICLALGLTAVLGILVFASVGLGIGAGVAALITGGIALSNKNNTGSSRAMAVIGMILGGGVLFLLLLLLLMIESFR
ncbi:MAG TPA: hypothetical protein VEY10_03765 [Flavisolibacter sp.]|jgi:hypothetical protein|nr:hypothetical protein [Flavisolibacter sp.]